jgi:hypothetical protein
MPSVPKSSLGMRTGILSLASGAQKAVPLGSLYCGKSLAYEIPRVGESGGTVVMPETRRADLKIGKKRRLALQAWPLQRGGWAKSTRANDARPLHRRGSKQGSGVWLGGWR